jgi:hypothetical protein
MVEWRVIKFYKTEAESKKEENYKSINFDMSIQKVEKSKDDEVRIEFIYKADFVPDIAVLRLYGYVLMGGEKKELNAFVDAWKAKKPVPREISEPLTNLIAYSSQLNGVLISRALNMPAPVIPPRLGGSQ